MRGKWNWRRVLLSGLALLVALSAALTAEVRASRAATTTRAAAPAIIVGLEELHRGVRPRSAVLPGAEERRAERQPTRAASARPSSPTSP